MTKSPQFYGIIVFVYVLLDSMTSYFLRPILGAEAVPVNAILPFVIVILIKKYGLKAFRINAHVWIALVVGFTFFLLGVLFLPEFKWHRIATIVTALSAFFVGHFAARWSDDAEMYGKAFLIVGGLYVMVCILAIHDVFPSVFPVIKRISYYMGVPSVRPEITTDQNFQFFYVFPVVLVLALPFRPLRSSAAFVGAVGGLYVLNILMTRSGFLVMLGAIALCLMAPLFTKELGRKKILILPLIILALVLFNIDLIARFGEPIHNRFFNWHYNTLEGRILALQYLQEHILEPTWWFPRGNAHFRMLFYGTPHSNPTAVFLEAGLPGLYMYAIVVVLPLFYLGRMLLKGELDGLATLILIGGTASFFGQLSLNVPLMDQVWLWAGAVQGTRERMRHPSTTLK
jgi:hypothetical protein